MGMEIERKFLVVKEIWDQLTLPQGLEVVQGYLCNEPQKSVRVRIADDQAYLTIKGETSRLSRPEYEYPIPLKDTRELLQNLCGERIEKVRYRIQHADHLWEVDVFEGANAGLMVAEVELKTEDELVALPNWIGQEVTGDSRYYNASLVKHPFSKWKA